MSSAAVLAVYAAGYNRTRSAAAKFDTQATERRPSPPARVASTPLPVAPPNAQSSPIEKTEAAAPQATADTKPLISEPAKQIPATDTATPLPSEPVAVAVTSAPPAPPLPPAATIPAPPSQPPTPVWKDGTYTGWGTSRHGDIQASVIIEGGRIASATIAQCLTRYSCDVIEKLPPEVAQRQSPEVDYVSGATQSTNAFYYAVVDALNKAK